MAGKATTAAKRQWQGDNNDRQQDDVSSNSNESTDNSDGEQQASSLVACVQYIQKITADVGWNRYQPTITGHTTDDNRSVVVRLSVGSVSKKANQSRFRLWPKGVKNRTRPDLKSLPANAGNMRNSTLRIQRRPNQTAYKQLVAMGKTCLTLNVVIPATVIQPNIVTVMRDRRTVKRSQTHIKYTLQMPRKVTLPRAIKSGRIQKHPISRRMGRKEDAEEQEKVPTSQRTQQK
ncbi:hypothetical protein EDB89DRAFT_1902274 [Lactarius sanguifluus]|nr:hypothetical protein EDB89DRAFT_1902274 [Lactarius sanguifluus]